MELIKQYENNLDAINRKRMILLLKDYKDSFDSVNTIQKLLLLNKQFEQELNEILPTDFKVKDLTTLIQVF